MILIADSGATKTDWCFGNTLYDCQVVHTEGINPFHLTEEKIKQIIQESLIQQLPFSKEEVKAVFLWSWLYPRKSRQALRFTRRSIPSRNHPGGK